MLILVHGTREEVRLIINVYKGDTFIIPNAILACVLGNAKSSFGFLAAWGS